MDDVVTQAEQLNVFHVVILGKGEPLYDDVSKANLFRLIRRHRHTNFLVFTNGTTLEEQDAATMCDLPNLFLLVSVDGLEETNDRRRGSGVFGRAVKSLQLLAEYRLVFGYSTTVFRANYREVTSPAFVRHMAERGCIIGVYLPFAPVDPAADAAMMLNAAERQAYIAQLRQANARVEMPLVDLELFEQIHGCRARRGSSIYVDGVTGKVSPCPKTPFSPEECNLYLNPHKDRLLEVLRTDFFRGYRGDDAECKHCSLRYAGELDRLLELPGIPLQEQTRVVALHRKLGRT